VMLHYREVNKEFQEFIPIDSRTVDGYTAFHAAFLVVRSRRR
jgi:hypothetical protein